MSVTADQIREEKLPSEVHAALVETLFGTTGSFIAGMIGGLLVPTVAWMRSHDPFYLGCALVIMALGAYRVSVFLLHQRADETQRRLDAKLWERRYAIGGISFMLAVGLTAAILCFRQPDEVTTLYGVVITLGCAGALAGRNAGRPFIVYGQVLSICLPIGAVFLFHYNGWYIGLAAILLLIMISAKSTTTFLNKVLVTTLMTSREASIQRGRFSSALDSMSHGLCMADESGKVIVVNRRLQAFFGLDPHMESLDSAEMAGRIAEHGQLTGDARKVFEAAWLEHTSRREPSVFSQSLCGRVYDFRCEPRGEAEVVVVVEDVTDARMASRRIEHLAHFDVLTGLPNRMSFHAQLEKRLASWRVSHRPLALISVDLDRFKEVNDTRGHPTGDALLQAVAQRLKSAVKKNDLVARFGGDEFQILMQGLPAESEAVQIRANRIISQLSAGYVIDGQVITIGASIGVAFVSSTISTADELVRCADLALYRAKAEGRGVCRLFSPEFDLAQKRKHEIEQDLRDAIANDRLELHYQPVVDVRNGEIKVCEALVRMQHPTKGRIPPDEFISIAEETGLIVQLGDWVLRRACLDAATWPAGVAVAVNFSPKQFLLQPNLAGDIADVLAETGLPPARLEVEITESTIIEAKDALEQLRAISAQGIKITLDDFGTGYSSLSYLRLFPVDKIKIDRSFAQDVTSRASQAVIGSVSVLADLLGVELVIEGIETDEQLSSVLRWKAPLIQGYLFSRPLPNADVLPLLEKELPFALRALRKVA